jgi:hypothetical protein
MEKGWKTYPQLNEIHMRHTMKLRDGTKIVMANMVEVQWKDAATAQRGLQTSA